MCQIACSTNSNFKQIRKTWVRWNPHVNHNSYHFRIPNPESAEFLFVRKISPKRKTNTDCVFDLMLQFMPDEYPLTKLRFRQYQNTSRSFDIESWNLKAMNFMRHKTLAEQLRHVDLRCLNQSWLRLLSSHTHARKTIYHKVDMYFGTKAQHRWQRAERVTI